MPDTDIDAALNRYSQKAKANPSVPAAASTSDTDIDAALKRYKADPVVKATAQPQSSMRAATPAESSRFHAADIERRKRLNAIHHYDPSDPLGYAKELIQKDSEDEKKASGLGKIIPGLKSGVREALVGAAEPSPFQVIGAMTAGLPQAAQRVMSGLFGAMMGKEAVDNFRSGNPVSGTVKGVMSALALKHSATKSSPAAPAAENVRSKGVKTDAAPKVTRRYGLQPGESVPTIKKGAKGTASGDTKISPEPTKVKAQPEAKAAKVVAKQAVPDPKPAEAAKPGKVEPTIRQHARSPEMTSARKLWMTDDRTGMGQEPLPVAVRKRFQESFDNAVKKGYNTHEGASQISDEVLHKPRALNDEETAGVVARAHELKLQHEKRFNDLAAEADPARIAQHREVMKMIEAEFDKHSTALRQSGTEKGRALASQKLTLDRDYSLINIKTRAKMEKGAPLDPAREAAYEKISRDHEALKSRVSEMEKQAAEHKSKIAKLEDQQAINKLNRDAGLQARRQTRTSTKEDLLKERDNLHTEWQKLRTSPGPRMKKQSGAVYLPTQEVTIIRKLALNAVKRGVNSIDGIVDEIHTVASQHIDDLTPRMVRDAISGYGKAVQAASDPHRQQLSELNRQMRVLSQIEDIRAGKTPEKSGFQRGPQSEEVKALNAELKQEMLSRGLKKPVVRSEAAKLQSRKTYLQNRITEMQGRIDRGETSRPLTAKAASPVDAEVQRLQKQLAGQKLEMEKMIASEKKPHWSDYVNAAQRAAILSGLQSAEKIGAASATGTAGDLGEGIFSDMLSKVPGVGRIAAKAPSATPIQVKAHVDAMVKAWTNPRDSWTAVKGQPTAVERAYYEMTGKHPEIRPTNKVLQTLELFGNAHKGIKLPKQRSAWERGLVRYTEFELKQGNDPSSFDAQIRIAEGAYKESLNAIYRGDNMAVSAWQQGVGVFKRMSEKGDTRGHKIAGTIAKVGTGLEMPIIRIPSNMISESLLYGPQGIGRALIEVVGRNGIKNLTPAQANIVMKAGSKGLIGTAVCGAVWFDAGKHVKVSEKDGDLGPNYKKGDMQVFGHRVVNAATHLPVVMGIKTTVVARKAYDAQPTGSIMRKRSAVQKSTGLAAAAYSGILETAQDTPFISDIIRVGGAMRSEQGLKAHVANVGKSFVPVEVRNRVWPKKVKQKSVAGRLDK